VNHPSQWDYALSHFPIQTKWIVGLDADQYLSNELREQLQEFDPDKLDPDVNGIYFNRKYYFKGKWIRFGGYYPKYMLKMFKTGCAKSDRSELLDHRFAVEGKTVTWKHGILIEENFKENKIAFWIDKHNRYSDLVAQDEYDKKIARDNGNKGKWKGSPDERIAHMKWYWRKMPRMLRPFIYFIYRYIFLAGFMDGRVGFIFHFLQAYWFRLLIDIKIGELKEKS